jgi:hypothetical protein
VDAGFKAIAGCPIHRGFIAMGGVDAVLLILILRLVGGGRIREM